MIFWLTGFCSGSTRFLNLSKTLSREFQNQVTSPPHPRPLSPKGARGEITRVYALAPLGRRVSVSRRTGEGDGSSPSHHGSRSDRRTFKYV